MRFINQQRKRSPWRLRQLCHVPGRGSNELWRITGHSHALPVHHRTLYLSSLRSRILQSTIRRARQTLQFHSYLYNRFHPILSRAILSFTAPLHPGHRRMAISWQADYHAYKCMTWGAVYITISCLSFTCDIVMFVIPSMLIHLLHVPLRRKLELACVMFPGVL